MSQPNCLENCQVWPVAETQLEEQHMLLGQKLKQARTEEMHREQQHHESDGVYVPSGRVDEVETQVEWEASLIETERNSLRDIARECTGAPCKLAEYCVRKTLSDDLKELL